MVVHVFMSHTKKDKDFCDTFDVAAARVGLRIFRSEYETIESPAWRTIKREMDSSSAMFLLVGKELVKSQELSDSDRDAREEWKHTQNWIAYEIGLACERGIDIWVFCDSVQINFPVPYLKNYALWGKFEFIKWILGMYREKGKSVERSLDLKHMAYKCPNKDCGSEFNLFSIIDKGEVAICPTCLRPMLFPNGWLLDHKEVIEDSSQ